MDASVMAGETLAAGAVGVVSGVANPVRLARTVLAEGREVLLVGEDAAALAASKGLTRCTHEMPVTAEARRRWREGRPAAGETNVIERLAVLSDIAVANDQTTR